MQNIPTAQYYTTTDHTVARLIRLTAILSIIIGGAGLLQIVTISGAVLMGDARVWTSLRGNPIDFTITSLANLLLLSPLRFFSGIGCFYRKKWARRGMIALAVLMIANSAVFDCLYCYRLISGRLDPFGARTTPFDRATFSLQMAIGFATALFLPLLMLSLFRSEGAKQFFKPET